ncbi:MAG: NADPH:quinone oxidoreductase family protein [Actinobacteria bacterium]|nr:NADPH:quinone oxidoreductase family protein [Actinomycetota bacterium]
MRAVQISRFGGPEVLEFVELPTPKIYNKQELINVSFAGVNFADTHLTENTYMTKHELPFVPGLEIFGTLTSGQRVMAFVDKGGYAQFCLANSESVVEVPDGLSPELALPLMVQGVTAWHLINTCAKAQINETVVIHAAAGGTGSIAVQLAKLRGCKVIAVASSPEKRKIAIDLGADVAISITADFTDAILAANNGNPVDVVLDMVGGDVLAQGMAALAPFGRLVTFGTASRQKPEAIQPLRLVYGGISIIGFWLSHCRRKPKLLTDPLTELLQLFASKKIKPLPATKYALSDAKQAHIDLLARKTVGKLILDTSY